MADVSEALDLIDRCIDLVADTATRRDVLEFAGKRAGVKGEELARKYPAPSGKPLAVYYERTDSKGRVYRSKFKTLKQQRKVMALATAGKIPYGRTGYLGRSMTSDAEAVDTGVRIRVGTNRPGAPFVLGKREKQQSHYHDGTWTPLDETIDQGKSDILDVFGEALRDRMRAHLKGGA